VLAGGTDSLEGGTSVAAHSYGLVTAGAGSGNMRLAEEFAGWQVAVDGSGRC